MKNLVVTLLAMHIFCSCQKDNLIVPENGSLDISFENFVDNEPLALNKKYLSPSNDTFSVQQFKYYISNVSLYTSGKIYTEKLSYHLIEHGKKQKFQLLEIPVGSYDSLKFSIGIDSSHNHRIDFTGDLDPNNNMVWDWNSGYKFLLMEGNFYGPTSITGLVFHIGNDINYRTIRLSAPIHVVKGKPSNVSIKSDINGMFRSPHPIDFDIINEAMFGTNTTLIANNYKQGMFSVRQIINP